MSGWRTDIENAPRTGKRVLCWAPEWEPTFLVWKTNHRIVKWHAEGEYPEHAESYFGIPGEFDDYELALPGGGPTKWFDLPEPE
jgi:hypothetical protein